jgi:hypothetical protein
MEKRIYTFAASVVGPGFDAHGNVVSLIHANAIRCGFTTRRERLKMPLLTSHYVRGNREFVANSQRFIELQCMKQQGPIDK